MSREEPKEYWNTIGKALGSQGGLLGCGVAMVVFVIIIGEGIRWFLSNFKLSVTDPVTFIYWASLVIVLIHILYITVSRLYIAFGSLEENPETGNNQAGENTNTPGNNKEKKQEIPDKEQQTVNLDGQISILMDRKTTP